MVVLIRAELEDSHSRTPHSDEESVSTAGYDPLCSLRQRLFPVRARSEDAERLAGLDRG